MPQPQPAPALDEEQARLLSEALQAEGKNALTASTAAREKLAAVEITEALEAETRDSRIWLTWCARASRFQWRHTTRRSGISRSAGREWQRCTMPRL